jgi:hypothetical protein
MANVEAHQVCTILLIACGACGGDPTPDVDPCKLAGQSPTVVVGIGQDEYAALSEGATMPVEAGPQGGHHIWVALRTMGLGARGTIISITGRVDSIPATIGPFDTIFQLEPTADGWCEVSGIRFQIDQALSVDQLDGRMMQLTARLRDKVGASAEETRGVVLRR